ncbi:MAG: heavy metal translocating P-type ATPase [Gemmatimonadota bacterium]
MVTEVMREAAAPATSPDTTCAHCGLPVPAGLRDDSVVDQFCCSGCRTAYAILNEHGLGKYYSFPERREAPVASSGRSFEEFDHPAFAERYVREVRGGRSRIELYLEGVHCASCVWLVERVPLVITGVVRVELDVRRSLAVVEWNAADVPLSAIARGLDQLGYTPHPFRGVERDTMRRREDRAMLVRIGVAGAIAINVMLAALALYAGDANGMDPAFARFFRWVSFVLVIPAFVWPGRIFFIGALAALRTRSLHMDLPIAIALAAGFVSGAVNTIRDAGPVYFDGLSVLILLLLAGRFLQQRAQRMATDSAELRHAVAPLSARVVDGPVTRALPVEALVPGMVLDVRAGESFGADGVVGSGQSSVNVALLTGESRPVAIAEGASVFAGTLNVQAPVRVRVEECGESIRIARLLRAVEDSARRRAPVVLLADRMAGLFVAAVLVAAALTFVIKWRIAPAHALDDAIALLIVTCPCALALATPLAMTVAMGRAAGRGMLIKGGDALELLSSPGTLVLDKTGTITEGVTAVVSCEGPEWLRPMVLALEEGSSHPIADGFRRAWPGVQAMTASSVRHVSGAGIEGAVGGRRVRVGSPRFVAEWATRVSADARAAMHMNPTMTSVHIAVDGEVVAVAAIGDRIRDDARQSLDHLRSQGWRTVMLSGDAQDVVSAVAITLGFAPSDAVGGASPEEKLAFVERLKARRERVVMVGDGVNDAAAIAASHVGIGVHGGAEACLATADIYLTRPGLSPLVELTEGSRRTMRVIRRNIAFSLGYNVIGATLAVAGLLTPLVAAVLMPASSVTVVLASWLGGTFSRSRTA